MLYLVGQPTVFDVFVNEPALSSNTWGMLDYVGLFFSSTEILLIIGMLGAIILGSLAVGTFTGNDTLSAVLPFILPAVALMGIANFFLLPIGNLIGSSPFIPEPFNWFLFIIINVMLLGAIYEFIGGRPM